MQRVLIVYGSNHGQTGKIARRIADLLALAGDSVTLADVRYLFPDVTPASFDAVIVGGSVNFGRHQRQIRRFVRTHADALNAMPAAFFSVSGAAGSADPAERARARGYLASFLGSTGWQPWLADTVAGALAFTRYGVLLRWAIRRMSARSGGPSDTSRDHEFTDWEQVAWFVEAFIEMSRPATSLVPSSPVSPAPAVR
jgi:menaquinone-dependent protoporphyrinogen oxidase